MSTVMQPRSSTTAQHVSPLICGLDGSWRAFSKPRGFKLVPLSDGNDQSLLDTGK